MQFSTFKTTLAAWLHRTDLTSYLADFANIALHKLENTDVVAGKSWKYMEYRGTTTSADNSITFPTSIKNVDLLRCYANGVYYPPMEHKSLKEIMLAYPDSTDTGTPCMYAWQEYTDEFIIAPYPDTTYTFEIVCSKFTADMSADADTNWWLTYHWEVLLYGALLEAQSFIIGDERIPIWQMKYNEGLDILRAAEQNKLRPSGYTAESMYTV